VSLFVEPEERQIEASAAVGADMVELHTGAFANALGAAQQEHVEKIERASIYAHKAGLKVNAGHGINYSNIRQIRRVPHLSDLNIGHSIVSRAVFVGLEAAVREMIFMMSAIE
jgi:pyridoxine 5-phosphate synthase